MPSLAAELAERLAERAESVCRHYLSNGRRHGAYWLVGDVRNSPGRSLYVRLRGPTSGKGAAGHWTDAATGEHGDLLDLIGLTCSLSRFRDTADEARRFLNLGDFALAANDIPTPAVRQEAARRLYAISKPFGGSHAESYLRGRGIVLHLPPECLRFHPRCFYRPDGGSLRQSWPAMIAAVTDLEGRITGVHRTWLDPGGFDPERLGKAPVEWPKRAIGDLLGNAVRYGVPDGVMAVGEGIETSLSVACAIPLLPIAAALSAAHLAAMQLPSNLRRLYVLQDRDSAGRRAQGCSVLITKWRA